MSTEASAATKRRPCQRGTIAAASARPSTQSLGQFSAGMCRRERALAKARSDTALTKPAPQSVAVHRLAKKVSSKACCEPERIVSSVAISAGKGSLRLRVKASGNSGCRARCAKSTAASTSAKSSNRDWIESRY